MKVLPETDEEKASTTTIRHSRPKIRSRRFPVKVMYLGVVAAPRPDHNFDGRVFLKRVSKRKKLARGCRNSRFSVNVLINQSITDGEVWRNIMREENHNILTAELQNQIVEMYDLDEFVAERLTFSYYTYANGKKVIKDLAATQYFNELGMMTTETGEQVPLTIDNLKLQVKMKKGDEYDKDTTCDSEFMLDTIPDIATIMREKFHWIPDTEIIYLVME